MTGALHPGGTAVSPTPRCQGHLGGALPLMFRRLGHRNSLTRAGGPERRTCGARSPHMPTHAYAAPVRQLMLRKAQQPTFQTACQSEFAFPRNRYRKTRILKSVLFTLDTDSPSPAPPLPLAAGAAPSAAELAAFLFPGVAATGNLAGSFRD